MRLRIRRLGGIAGVTLRAEVDTANLPAEEASRLEVAFRDLEGEKAAGAAQPDAFRYEITRLDDPGSRPVTVEQRDLPAGARELIGRVAKSGEIERR